MTNVRATWRRTVRRDPSRQLTRALGIEIDWSPKLRLAEWLFVLAIIVGLNLVVDSAICVHPCGIGVCGIGVSPENSK